MAKGGRAQISLRLRNDSLINSGGWVKDHARRGGRLISIVDPYGNAIAMTTTIEDAFGARQMVHGFLLNNELTDFNFEPADAQGKPVANRVQAGKRPRSSMAPILPFAVTVS